METAQKSPASFSLSIFLRKNLFVIVFVMISFIVGGVVGFFGGEYNRGSTNEKTTEEESTSIATSLLNHPMIYQWRGNVRGTLIAKDEASITLEDDSDNKLVIPLYVPPYKEGKTFFFDATNGLNGSAKTELTEIPLGSKLQGDFFVVPESNSNTILGSSFEVIEKP